MRLKDRDSDAFAQLKGNPKKPVALCDFDGTISVGDVGEMLIEHFLGRRWRQLDDRYHSGEFGMVELYERCFAEIRASRDDFERFVMDARIDCGFKEFADACAKEGIYLAVISDGFDFYIERILSGVGLSRIAVHSNRLRFGPKAIELSFPNRNDSCWDCANCKNRIVEEYGRKNPVIYIGNGLSDCCAAKSADLVFAKDGLAKHLKGAGFPFVEYNDFEEVISILRAKGVLSRK